jgi:transcriptional regulator with XRE-family HTH domain
MDKNTNFMVRLDYLVQSTGKSYNQIEQELGYPRNALNNYKNGSEPSASRLLELSSYFKVTPAYLFGETDRLEIDLVYQVFNKFSPEEKKEMYLYCHSWMIEKLEENCFKAG